jgi:hypothetical protein
VPAARRVERRTPALVAVPGELEIVAVAGHAGGDPADAEPAGEPGVGGADQRRLDAAIAEVAYGEQGEQDPVVLAAGCTYRHRGLADVIDRFPTARRRS